MLRISDLIVKTTAHSKEDKVSIATPRRLDPIDPVSLSSSAGFSSLPGAPDSALPGQALDRPASKTGTRLAPIAAVVSEVYPKELSQSLQARAIDDVPQAAPTVVSQAVAVPGGGESADPEEEMFDQNARLSIRQSEDQGKSLNFAGSSASPKFGSAASIDSFNFSKLGSMMSDNFEESRGMFQHGEDGDEDFQDHGLFDPEEAEDESDWLEGVLTNDMTEAQRAVFVDSIRRERQRIKVLLTEGRRFESTGNLDAAQERYSLALEINPHDIYTLQRYATFMHMKRMNVEQAALYYKRAVKECVPSLISDLKTKKIATALGTMKQHSSVCVETPRHKKTSVSAADITRLLIHYGRFLVSAQGNESFAEAVFKKAVEISPNDSTALATYAHFLSSSTSHFPPPPKGENQPSSESIMESSNGLNDGEGPSLPKETPNPVTKPVLFSRKAPSHPRSVRPGSRDRQEEAEELFRQSIKAEPTNALHLLWYARLLKNLGKYPQVHLLYILKTTCTRY
jgi:tetratricopeptide (TPR) repeat protein